MDDKDDICRIEDVIDVSLLSGDAALDSVNDGVIECTCDKHHTCQICDEFNREFEKLYKK